MMYVNLYVMKEQLLAYKITYLLSHNQQRYCRPLPYDKCSYACCSLWTLHA